MSADDKKPEVAAGTDPGVLGNLPRSRPTVRSPRRAEPAGGPAADPAPADPPPRSAEAQSPSSPADIEALARSGLALAGGAATLGLRLAGRAAAAARGAVPRR